MTRRGVAAAVAVAVLASMGAGCTREDDGGRLADARPAQVTGTTLWAQLPTGKVSVTIGKPVSRIPGDQVVGGEALEAAEDREFLPVQVDYADLEGTPADAPQDPAVDPADLTTLAVVLASHSYPVPFSDVREASYLDVAKASDAEPALEVGFDGVQQSVDAAGHRETGEAAGLYDASTRVDLVSCGEQGADTPEGVSRTCRYALWEYPYVEGLGWASKRTADATWVVVTAQTWLRADQIRSGEQVCRPTAMAGNSEVRVDGQPATGELPVAGNRRGGGRGLGSRGAYLLVPADQHGLEITSRWRCRIGEDITKVEFVDRVTSPS